MRPSLRFWRRGCQALVALGFVLIPLINMRGCTLLSGNLLSLDMFGLSFVDPLAFLQTLAGGPPHARATMGAALTLLVALLLGRIFCSWICPYGLASELCCTLRGRGSGSMCRSPNARNYPARPFAVKTTLAVTGFLAVLLLAPEPLLNQLSMPGWYSRAMQHAFFFGLPLYGALLFPALLLLEARAGSRVWCRYLCPQSVLLALCAALPRPGLRLRFIRKQCVCSKNERPCLHACSLALNPRSIAVAQRLDCTNCGDCVDACSSRGQALRLALRDVPHGPLHE